MATNFLLYSITDSLDSIIILSQHQEKKLPKVRDLYVIARTIVETTINLIYILAKGKKGLELAKKHWKQKAYRDLNRELKVNERTIGLKWEGKIDLENDQELKQAIKDFTSKRGKEITSWTPDSLIERLEVIDKKYGSKITSGLQFPLFLIYRHASEISHGTVFGAMFFFGLTEPKKSRQDQKEQEKGVRAKFSGILFMVFIAISSLCRVLAKELPNKGLGEMNKEFEDALFNEEWIKNEK